MVRLKMTSIEIVQELLNMEVLMSEKDAANIIIASRVDAVVKRKTLEDVIKYLKAHELEDR